MVEKAQKWPQMCLKNVEMDFKIRHHVKTIVKD